DALQRLAPRPSLGRGHPLHRGDGPGAGPGDERAAPVRFRVMVPERRTPRLLLRGIRPQDLDALAAMNGDPRVMEHLPGPMTREESEAQLEEIREHWAGHGFGWWVVEVPGVAPFIGWLGLVRPKSYPLPCVEVGWRLAAAHWNRGYATEGARE